MAADKDYLRQLAIAIRDEYRKGANTAYRVGSLLLSLIDTDANIESLNQYFLRKDKEDVAQEVITFLKGLVSNLVQSTGFSPGERNGLSVANSPTLPLVQNEFFPDSSLHQAGT